MFKFNKTLLVTAIALVSTQSFATSFSLGDTLTSPAWAFTQAEDNDHNGGADQGDNDNGHDGDADQGNDNNDHDGDAGQSDSDKYDVSMYGEMTMEVTDCSTVAVTLTHTLADFSVVSDNWTVSTSSDLCTNTTTDAQVIELSDDNGTSFTLKIAADQSMSATLQQTKKEDDDSSDNGDEESGDNAVYFAPNLSLSTSTPPFGLGVY